MARDQRSFADRIMDALAEGGAMTWSELCTATGLTLFWVRETLCSLVEEHLVDEDVYGGGHIYRLK